MEKPSRLDGVCKLRLKHQASQSACWAASYPSHRYPMRKAWCLCGEAQSSPRCDYSPQDRVMGPLVGTEGQKLGQLAADSVRRSTDRGMGSSEQSCTYQKSTICG